MRFLFAFFLVCVMCLQAGDTVRPGLEGLDYEYSVRNATERQLVDGLKAPLLAGRDVKIPLTYWFDGRLAVTQGNGVEAMAAWNKGLEALKKGDLPLLPIPEVQENPFETYKDTALDVVTEFSDKATKIRYEVVHWKVDGLDEYGMVFSSEEHKGDDGERPVILYLHGAAFGIPASYLFELASELVPLGYVIIAPALRGEPLFQGSLRVNGKEYKCGGDIENLDGEVADCLSMLSAIWKRPGIQKGRYAMIGHSFGAGVGLVTAAVAGKACECVISYDAWLVNPQRYYWDRMARGANNWLSWADYCNQDVDKQLSGLIKRSVVHRARNFQAALLMFIGGGYSGSVFHQSHEDFIAVLKSLGKSYRYEVVPEAGHNFVLYTDTPAARQAAKKRNVFLLEHFPVKRGRSDAKK